MTGYIYNLYAKTENDIFYIGATTNPKGRIMSHRNNYPYYIFDCRIELSIIEEIEITEWKDLKVHERYWIQQFNAWGFDLLNYNLYYGFDSRLLANYIKFDKEMKDGTFWD